jgi:hypothetical protein
VGGLLHLTRRFVGSLRPGPPDPGDEAWARSLLMPQELAVWQRMSNPDRRHAVTVARAVAECWPAGTDGTRGPDTGPGGDPGTGAEGGPDRAVLAAALLHDSGKVLSGLRTPARVVATVVWAVLGDATAERWLDAPDRSRRARLARYRRHPELGAELLRDAGSDPLTSSWAAEHHRPEDRWTVPVEIGRVLKACDDD